VEAVRLAATPGGEVLVHVDAEQAPRARLALRSEDC
jgi:hypothetical protein